MANGATNGQVEKLAENVWLKLIARISIIIAAAFAPIAGSLMNRTINALNEFKSFQIRTEITVQELSDTIDERTSDRYTGTQANQDWQQQDRRDNRQEANIQRNTDDIRTIERNRP